ncbi:MAG TPA: YafY family protein [Polyangiaceae bacterium]|nr:YafY family protein [Polyangiaceae bacterium]
MRRADRLFQIVQELRRRRVSTAAHLAETLEVSERTVYRDIADLVASGVHIEGEAGVGYRIGDGFEMPPLSFNLEEIEALMLGLRMVQQWGDVELANAARSITGKVETVLPVNERKRLESTALFALSFDVTEAVRSALRRCRKAVNERRKLEFEYADREQRASTRVIRPLGLYFWGRSWTVGAYCELRQDHRSFRLDRMTDLRVSRERFELVSPVTLFDFWEAMKKH